MSETRFLERLHEDPPAVEPERLPEELRPGYEALLAACARAREVEPSAASVRRVVGRPRLFYAVVAAAAVVAALIVLASTRDDPQRADPTRRAAVEAPTERRTAVVPTVEAETPAPAVEEGTELLVGESVRLGRGFLLVTRRLAAGEPALLRDGETGVVVNRNREEAEVFGHLRFPDGAPAAHVALVAVLEGGPGPVVVDADGASSHGLLEIPLTTEGGGAFRAPLPLGRAELRYPGERGDVRVPIEVVPGGLVLRGDELPPVRDPVRLERPVDIPVRVWVDPAEVELLAWPELALPFEWAGLLHISSSELQDERVRLEPGADGWTVLRGVVVGRWSIVFRPKTDLMLAETPRWSRVIAGRDAGAGVLVIATPLDGYVRVRFTGGAGMLVLEGPRGTVVGPISGARSQVMRGAGVRMIETGRQREKSDPGLGRGWALVPGPYEAAAVTDDGRILRARFEITEPGVDVEIALR